LILVVDDNPSIREIIELSLSASNYRVCCVENGREALAVMEREVPRLVILDLSMPGMSGYEVLAHIRNLDASRHVPVICLSALPPEEERERVLKEGARDYLSKPFHIPDLLECVRMHAEQEG